MKISEIITDKYKLRIPPTVYYELLADVVEAEDEQEPTDRNFTKADIDAIVKAINEGWELRVNEVLDKIYADIQRLRGCSCSCSDGIIDDIEDILDKYKAEAEG